MAPCHTASTGVWGEVCDSKLLSPQRRNTLAPQIQAAALAWGIGAVAATTIDQIGIASATRQAMLQAIASLHLAPDFLLIDWVRLPQAPIAQQSLVKADRDIVSVAAASILAKVHRDQLMITLHERYPQYGFVRHKGYGAPAHLSAIAQFGPCPEHRQSFAPLAQQLSLFSA
jgi:ribonuclease HII